MVNQRIRIKRWKIYVRRLVDNLKAFVSRFVEWGTGSARRSRQSIKINLLGSGKDGTRDIRGGEVIRIRPRPVAAVLDSEAPTDPIALPPLPTDSPPARTRATERVTTGNISITDVGKLCKACGSALVPGSPMARCQTDSSHVIHRKCIRLMKYKCPHCGGRLV